MNLPANDTSDAMLYTGSVVRLASLFFDELAEVGQFEAVAPDALPAEYRRLLAHNEHMTVTLEEFYNGQLDVRPLAEWRDESSYARNSLLARKSDGRILQFGIMRIWLDDLPAEAVHEITIKKLPLGRVLIDRNVLREVELITLWRIKPGPVLRQLVPGITNQPIYGRSAQILVDERPTVQMLEIAAPIPG